MKNTFGNSISITLFGESHGDSVGCVIDGLAPGLRVNPERIAVDLSRRRPSGLTDTKRREPDNFKIVSGVFNGHTTGTPLCILIPNVAKKSGDYAYGKARPSHADYTAFVKYHGYEDYRGGGHFSGRITAAIVAAGGIILPALSELGIEIGSHIAECSGVHDAEFSEGTEENKEEIRALREKLFPVLNDAAGEEMSARILKAAASRDSVGGIIATAVVGVPAGLGEPWFDSVESEISHAVFSIGAVKGIEFGLGFAAASMAGSAFNDAFCLHDGRVETRTNHNGGINGGITNGMPILFRTAVKPTPSISMPQQTVNFLERKEEEIAIVGRHDPAIVRRICPVIDAMTGIIIADLLSQRYGTDVLKNGIS